MIGWPKWPRWCSSLTSRLADAQMESGLAIASALLSLETADYYSAHPQGVTVSTKANVNWLLEDAAYPPMAGVMIDGRDIDPSFFAGIVKFARQVHDLGDARSTHRGAADPSLQHPPLGAGPVSRVLRVTPSWPPGSP